MKSQKLRGNLFKYFGVTPDKEFIESDLNQNEEILWKGQPRQGVFWGAYYWISITLAGITTILAVWMNIVTFVLKIDTTHPTRNAFASVGFSFCALILLLKPLILDPIVRKRTHYAVTNQRVLIKSVGIITTLDISKLPQMRFKLSKSGLVTISFGKVIWGRSITYPPSFEQVDEGVIAFIPSSGPNS